MTRPEIEQAAAALLQPEGKRKHKVELTRAGSLNAVTAVCSKCRNLSPHGPCDYPDPITICDDPEDEAYEASMGMAVVWMRKIQPGVDICHEIHRKSLDEIGELYTLDGMQAEDAFANMLWWLQFKATPSQLFEIILIALETK